MRDSKHPIDAILAPRNVALVGATEKVGSVGRTVLWNLISSPFGGTIFPINPKRPNVLGIKAYPSIKDVPEPVDLAVIVTPSDSVPEIISQCVEVGVKGAVVISAGFKEAGPHGVELERRVLAEAQRGGLRLIGPNCLGVMSPMSGLNATFASSMARPGNVGFISQSGALCTAVLDWSLRANVGFSAFVSIGSMLDLNWGDLIDYLGADPRTNSIVLYMESIGDARAFLSAAREVALTKPIIVIKAGRTQAAAKAAASHTGSLTGSDEVLDAAFRRTGVLRVNNISDLFYVADVLSKQPRPKGPRLTIVTNAGGPGVLATDSLILNGGALTELSAETFKALNDLLPAHWSKNNPVDILGDAAPERYAKALEITANDPNADGMLVVLTPQSMTDPTQTAEALKAHARSEGKPVLASWMGGADVVAGEDILKRAGIPTFPYPDTAAKIFNYMWQYSYNLKALYETPVMSEHRGGGPDRALVKSIIEGARKQRRTILTEFESKQVLSAYGVPIVDTQVARTADEAAAIADKLNYPVVIKLHSETITHKTDVGGVRLNLCNGDAVRDAFEKIKSSVAEKAGAEHFLGVTVQPMVRLKDGYELIIGSSIDPQFGPVLLFGSGGQLVEVYKDRALGLPPLNTTLAERMMEQTKIFKALKGVRGRKPVDLKALSQLMVRFSQLVVEQNLIKEIDINPLLAAPDRLVALDARVVIHDADVAEDQLPKPAITPYPVQYVRPWKMKNGTELTIRPIRPEDEPLLVHFHETLSDRSVYFRYFHMIKLSQRIAHERLTRICFIDYNREMALVAENEDSATGERTILGVGRITKIQGTNDAEFAIVVSDKVQRQGLGTELLKRVVEFARDQKVGRVKADILLENQDMQEVSRKLGFRMEPSDDPSMTTALMEL